MSSVGKKRQMLCTPGKGIIEKYIEDQNIPKNRKLQVRSHIFNYPLPTSIHCFRNSINRLKGKGLFCMFIIGLFSSIIFFFNGIDILFTYYKIME